MFETDFLHWNGCGQAERSSNFVHLFVQWFEINFTIYAVC